MPLKITSINDKTVSNTVKLRVDKKFRYESGLFVIEGVRMVRDAISCGAELREVFVDRTRKELEAEFSALSTRVYITEPYIINKMSAMETPQGVLATVAFKTLDLRPPAKNAVVLYGIQDPGNAGTIMRTALAAGVRDIYFVSSVDPYNPKTVKSSMSAVFHLNIYIAEEAGAVLPYLGGTELIAADMGGESVFKTAKPKRFSLVIGGEGAGVGKELLTAADRVVSVPMDKSVESLNAAVSAGILLYNLSREE